MEKKRIARFLKEKKRGAYSLLVEEYQDEVISMPTTLARTVIKEDLERELGESVEVRYFSLVRAISRLKKRKLEQSPRHRLRAKWNSGILLRSRTVNQSQVSSIKVQTRLNKVNMSNDIQSRSIKVQRSTTWFNYQKKVEFKEQAMFSLRSNGLSQQTTSF